MMARVNSWKPWEEHEDEYMRENYPKAKHVQDLQEVLDRSLQAIRGRAIKLKLNRTGYYPRKWSNPPACERIEDVDWKIYYLRTQENLNAAEIGERLGGLSKSQIHNRMHRSGLYYHPPMGEAPEWYRKGVIDF